MEEQKPYFDESENYRLYQIYPIPEKQQIIESVKVHAAHMFMEGNILYFITTANKYDSLKTFLPRWIEINRTTISSIDELVEQDPSKKELFKSARVWTPVECTGRKPGRSLKKKG